MGDPAAEIREVQTPSYGKLVIRTTLGSIYHIDMTALSGQSSFPRDEAAWKQVSIDHFGMGLSWNSRFEISVGAIIAMAYMVEHRPLMPDDYHADLDWLQAYAS